MIYLSGRLVALFGLVMLITSTRGCPQHGVICTSGDYGKQVRSIAYGLRDIAESPSIDDAEWRDQARAQIDSLIEGSRTGDCLEMYPETRRELRQAARLLKRALRAADRGDLDSAHETMETVVDLLKGYQPWLSLCFPEPEFTASIVG